MVDGEVMQLGKDIFVTVSEFKGKQYVGIRKYYQNGGQGDWLPGKNGISMPVENWVEFESKSQQMFDAVRTKLVIAGLPPNSEDIPF